jgi:hypothetical protein
MEEDNSLALKQHKEAYQNLIDSIGWLSSTTCPDLAVVHSFLFLYNNKPSAGHMKAAQYTLHYIYSTHDYGISFSSEDIAPMHSFIISLLPPMSKPTKMLFLPSPSSHPHSLRIVMPVGAPRLVALLPSALSFRSLSSAV